MQFVLNGEQPAFEELYGRYCKKLFGYFLRMMNYNKMQAEDALQDVFLKIAERPEQFDASKSFRTWLFCIASNYCKNYYRHEAVRHNGKDEIIAMATETDENTFLRLAAKLDAKKFDEALSNCLHELPIEKREAFILRFQEDKSIAEIATIQECSDGTVKSRLHYGIKFLCEKLKLYNPNTMSYEKRS